MRLRTAPDRLAQVRLSAAWRRYARYIIRRGRAPPERQWCACALICTDFEWERCISYLPVDCEWMPAESGECLPNCGGGIIERYYIITQEAANGGKDCPPFVKENITEVIECCRKCTLISYCYTLPSCKHILNRHIFDNAL